MVGLKWFAWDMGSIIKWMRCKNQLSIDGRWKDLEQHFEGASKTLRPFVWLHRQYLLPGAIEAQYGLFLFKQGRLEEALVKIDKAICKIKGKPRIFRRFHRSESFNILGSSFRARILILTGLGRYSEAREAAAELQQLTGLSGRPNEALATLEYKCGNLDEALALAQAVPPEDKQYDAMRAQTALAYYSKGELDNAIQALLYEPSDMRKFYTASGFELVSGTTDGSKLLELQRTKLAGVLQPARLILLAKVFITKEEFKSADQALDQAEKVLGQEPGIQVSYFRYRACSFAAQGKASEAENYIERMRAIVQKIPKRSLLWETHFTAGRCYLYLGRLADALAELTAAQGLVLHPIEKHATAYWIARTHEAAGDQQKAIPFYQNVVSDSIPSWMHKQAVEALAQHNN